MGEIRNQLKSQSLETVVPQSFEDVGGRVFPDEPSIGDQLDLTQIVNAWRSTHAPTYGNPIGQSSQTVQKAGASGEAIVTALEATKSQVWRVQGMAIANAGGAAPVGCKILLGDLVLTTDASGNPSGTTPVNSQNGVITYPLFVDLNSPLKFAVTSGTGTDATLIINAIKVSQ